MSSNSQDKICKPQVSILKQATKNYQYLIRMIKMYGIAFWNIIIITIFCVQIFTIKLFTIEHKSEKRSRNQTQEIFLFFSITIIWLFVFLSMKFYSHNISYLIDDLTFGLLIFTHSIEYPFFLSFLFSLFYYFVLWKQIDKGNWNKLISCFNLIKFVWLNLDLMRFEGEISWCSKISETLNY